MAHTFVIADDDENSAQVILQALKFRYDDASYHVARNGNECVDLLKWVVPDAIFLDLAMPEFDGWQTLRSIRAMPALESVPVIAMTAYDSANVAYDAMQAGFTAYLPKPIDLALLKRTIENLVG